MEYLLQVGKFLKEGSMSKLCFHFRVEIYTIHSVNKEIALYIIYRGYVYTRYFIYKMEFYWFWITQLVARVDRDFCDCVVRAFSVEKIEKRNLECGVIISLISPLIKWRRSITQNI